MSPPLLSLIVGARNDSYMGDFKWRFGTCINYLAKSLNKLGRLNDVEVVVCDWGSEQPIHEVLDLSADAAKLLRFIYVPTEVAKEAQKDSPFPIPIVQNVAIRRSRGKFIAQTDSDIVFTPLSLERLFAVLEEKIQIGVPLDASLMVCSRHHIPSEMIAAKPSLDELERYIREAGSTFPYDKFIPGFATPSALALLHRDVWEKVQGYDEELIYWGWMEIDLYFRLGQLYPWVDLDSFGARLYHMEHYAARSTGQTRKLNPMVVSVDFKTGNSQWGMKEKTFEEFNGTSNTPNISEHVDRPSEEARVHTLSTLSDKDIFNGIEDGTNLQNVAKRLQHFGEGMNATPELLNALQEYVNAMRTGTLQGWDFRLALSWYAKTFKPLTYLDLDVGLTDASMHVAGEFRPVSIIGLGEWVGGDERIINGPANLSTVLFEVCFHAGYMRYVTGPRAKALENILSDHTTPKTFDLVFAPLGIDDSTLLPLMPKVLERLSKGGAFIVHHTLGLELASFLNAVNEKGSLDQMRGFAGNKCAMLLKV